MRTTVNLSEDVLRALKARADREDKTLGEVIDGLARETFLRESTRKYDDIQLPVARRKIPGVVVTDEDLNRLREETGI